MDFYLKKSRFKRILPFYHTISDTPRAHFSHTDYFRTEADFRNDLEFFQTYYRSIDINLIDSSDCIYHLSFDDGMSEMYDIVAPILKQKKIHATFFINSDFIDNRKMFVKHKVSIIRNELQKSDNLKLKIAENLNIDIADFEIYLDLVSDDAKIDEIASIIKFDFRDYLETEKPYLTTKQLIELQNSGFNIANHGKSHINFNSLSLECQKAELLSNNKFIKELRGVESPFFAFPYGDSQISNKFFDWMYEEGEVQKSFGVSGLKKDDYPNHYHRILIEQKEISAEQIIKFEYFYYILKSLINKNTITRK